MDINISNIKNIIAPKHVLYPEATETEQIKSARKRYGVWNSIKFCGQY